MSQRLKSLLASKDFQNAKASLLKAIHDEGAKLSEIRPASDSATREKFTATLTAFQKNRGRDLYYPFLSSGIGNGPFVELEDGSVKMDLITGIGINFFGHSHPAYISEMVDVLAQDPLQGNLQPGIESAQVIEALLKRVGPGSRLAHAWLMCSGTMVNEVALKMIRQKNAPATKVFAFEDCFAGRSTAMQEITDNPGYRQGQPVYGEVAYLSFYDPALGLGASVQRTVKQMKENLTRYPGKFAAMMIELVQGEGGFRVAPREWYVRVFEEAKKANLFIWADEIQTFGRTGELFAYQTLDLAPFMDVVTIGKMFQACAVLYTAEMNPKPGLVAGTFSGTAVALRTARRTLELLDEGGFLGKDGKINQLSRYFVAGLEKLRDGKCRGKIGEIRAIGGMIGFVPGNGTADEVKKTVLKLFDLGLIAFVCGHGPYLVRLLPPLGVMTTEQIDLACQIIGEAL